jgi:(1->4)-alpha-D-glucan 1-alpha-D-glucosylmutase
VLLASPDHPDYPRRLAFAMKFQQYTGPVHAKGVEDTAFYRYNVLVSLNEVGGDPERFGRTPANFHEANRKRLEHWPLEMIGTATHDTKRGEDTRARINALSEWPEAWRQGVGRWMRINASSRTTVDGEHAPDRNDEYLYYQTLIGTWPAEPFDAPIPERAPDDYVERIQAYMQKAIKEAKTHTSWVNENQAYERALAAFVDATLRGAPARAFLASFIPLQRRAARMGAINGLAQLALKLTSPGVVDLYQGTELWDLHLVDPDNRQPVDYARRRAALEAFPSSGSEAFAADLLAHWHDGLIKLWTLTTVLRLRRESPALFLDGDYIPLTGADEQSARHLVAFARRRGTQVAITMVPRFTSELLTDAAAWPLGFEAWKTMHVDLPDTLGTIREFRHVLTGTTVRPLASGHDRMLIAADLFKVFPIAVLVGDAAPA